MRLETDAATNMQGWALWYLALVSAAPASGGRAYLSSICQGEFCVIVKILFTVRSTGTEGVSFYALGKGI